MTLAIVAGAIVLERTASNTPSAELGPRHFLGSCRNLFPSGHALFSLCFYGTLAGLLVGRLRRPAARAAVWAAAALLILAIFHVSTSGGHYPSDVIGGYLVAAFWISVFCSAGRFGATGS
jgi:membrane-associated phospholipid phosphatase